MPVLLTRPWSDSVRIAARLAGDGIDSLIWPLTEIVPGAEDWRMPVETEALLFTSRHGVAAFVAATTRRDLPVLTVGEATAEAARQAGFADVATGGADSAALIAAAAAMPVTRFFYPRGMDVSTDVPAQLAIRGKMVAEQVVYAARPGGAPPDSVDAALIAGRIRLVTLWSRRNAALFDTACQRHAAWVLDQTDGLFISENAARALDPSRIRRILVAQSPDANAMIDGIFTALRQKKG